MSRSVRLRLVAPVAVCGLFLGLAACGDDGKGDDASAEGTASSSPSASTSASASPSAAPTPVTGVKPPTELVLKVLKQGTGATVKSGDSVTVDYQGTNWTTNTVFDQSYTRGEPATFTTDGVVPGFGAALVGQKVGSQVVVGIPPEFGYGSAGQPSANIGGTDTLVFVIEIKSVAGGQLSQCNVKPGAASNSVTVTGKFGTTAIPKFAKNLSSKSLQRTILKKGTGKSGGLGDNVDVLLSVYNARSGEKIGAQPTSVPIGSSGIPAGIAAGVECVKQGSRVVTVFPAKDLPNAVNGTTIKDGDSLVLVTDVIKVSAAPAPAALPKTKAWTNPPTVKFNGKNPPTLTLPKS